MGDRLAADLVRHRFRGGLLDLQQEMQMTHYWLSPNSRTIHTNRDCPRLAKGGDRVRVVTDELKEALKVVGIELPDETNCRSCDPVAWRTKQAGGALSDVCGACGQEVDRLITGQRPGHTHKPHRCLYGSVRTVFDSEQVAKSEHVINLRDVDGRRVAAVRYKMLEDDACPLCGHDLELPTPESLASYDKQAARAKHLPDVGLTYALVRLVREAD